MNAYDYDLAIIGAGTAGLAAALVAKSHGARVALIEKHRIGGGGLWTGQVPLQTLIKSARVFETIGRGEEFGVHVENVRLRWSAVQLRIAAVRDEIKQLQREELARAGLEVIAATASFFDLHTLRLQSKEGESTLTASKLILATGTWPHIPAIDGLQETGFVTKEEIFELKNLPRSWIIVGDDPLGCEMAQAFVRFGCKVTLLQSESTLLPHEDEEVSAAADKLLRNEGVEVVCNAEVVRAEADGEKKKTFYQTSGESKEITASEIFIAAGDEAQLEDLNLKAVGAEWNAAGVLCDEYLRASNNLWACGAVTGAPLQTHAAKAQAKIAVQNALLSVNKKWDASLVSTGIFTDPEIARVGLTEAEAREKYSSINVYKLPFAKLHRAIIEGETYGFMKVSTTSSGRMVGAHIIGSNAGESIQQFAAAVRSEILLSELQEMIPALSEITDHSGE
jgi:pyruvate/2-oxoglutarate dehydrogenase complex dihydrolipoamide dehydrogenase (E3) component